MTGSVCVWVWEKEIECVFRGVGGQQEVERLMHGKQLMKLFFLGMLVWGGQLDLGPVHTDAKYGSQD